MHAFTQSFDKARDAAALPADAPPRLHFVFIDGTWNDETIVGPGDALTNVCKFYSLLGPDQPGRQIARYHRGVGNGEDHSWLGRLFDGFSGADGHRIVQAAYARIVQDWLPGDVLLLYGFSRGAALARVLANKLADEGIPAAITIHTAPRVNEVTGVVEPRFTDYTADPKKYADARLGFLGLWDTVASFGLPGNDLNLGYPLDIPRAVECTVHALALDETRNLFPPTLVQAGVRTAEEVWFPGVHSDVGGGYSEAEDELSRETLRFMLDRTRRWLAAQNLPAPVVSLENEVLLAGARPAQPRVFHFHGLGWTKAPRAVGTRTGAAPLVHHSVLDLQQTAAPLYAKPDDAKSPIPFSHYQPVNVKQLDGGFRIVT